MVGSPTRARGNGLALPSAIITVHEVPEAVKRGSSLAVSSAVVRHDRGVVPLVVKLYPELSVAAIKGKVDKELAVWYELRAINVTGSGRLVLNDALATLVSSFGYSRSTAYRLLRAGNGQFWGIYPSPALEGSSVIDIYALSRVAEWFSTYVSKLNPPVQVPVREFRGRKAKRAWLYSSFFKPEGVRARPIARESIEGATGVQRRQQQRYDKVAGTKRVANFACRQDAQGNLVPIRHLVAGKSRVWEKDRRLGNTYHSAALTTHRGMTKRVNAGLRRSLLKGEARPLKRFFSSAKSLVRCAHRHKDALLLVKAGERLIVGRMEWCIV